MKQYKTFADLKEVDVAYLLTMEHNRWVIKEMNVFEHNEKQLELVDSVYHVLTPREDKVFASVEIAGDDYVFADFSFIEDVASIMYMSADYAVEDFKYSHNL